MRTILFTTTVLASMAAAAPGALAESGETAVVETRAALNEAWGRSGTEERMQSKAAARAVGSFHTKEAQGQIVLPQNVWADNYAAGRVHAPADHR